MAARSDLTGQDDKKQGSSMLKRVSMITILMLLSSGVWAQYDHKNKERANFGSRDGRFETSLILAYQTGQEVSSEGGSSLDIDSSAGFGISVGWNWTAKLNLAYRFMANKPRYDAVIVPEDPNVVPIDVNEKMTKHAHQLNATYHFLDGAFTPYLSAGIGYAKLDSNIVTGPPQTGCWWDPWWGYICFADWKTYSTSEFSYNLGVGFRWDINNALFGRASYNREFIKVDSGSLDFDTATVEVGMMF